MGKHGRIGRALGLAVGVGAIVTAALPPPAAACDGYYDASEERRVPPPKPKPTPDEAIAIAEPAMSREEPVVAATAIAEAFPDLKSTTVDSPKRQVKVMRTMALALARVDGILSVRGSFFATSAAARTANLEWSIATLRALNAQRPNDPVLQAELGEVLARVPAHHAEALGILGQLAAKDVMGSARGYAELARLRAREGDVAGSDDAARRCKTMTKTPAICPASHDGAATKVAQTGA